MSTSKSHSSTDSKDPIGLESKDSPDTKPNLDDEMLYGNSSYKGHDTIYNTFSRKEIEDLNECSASKTLTIEKFNDIIQTKTDNIDHNTNLLIKEYLEDAPTFSTPEEISKVIKEFQELGESEKSNIKYLGDEM
jgi:hypothetical protein